MFEISVKICAKTYSQLLRRFVPAPNPFGTFINPASSLLAFLQHGQRGLEHNLIRCPAGNLSFQFKKVPLILKSIYLIIVLYMYIETC